jgi:hypothetical protein
MAERRVSDEEGSLVLVLLAAIVLGGLVTVLFADVSMGQRTARQDRDFHQAIQVADAGLQHAFTELAALDPDDPEPPLGGELMGDAELNGGTYDWVATRVGRERWQVRSVGSYRSATRIVEAGVGPHQLFALAAFGDLKLELRGGNDADSYNLTQSGTGQGSVGSNNEIVLRGNATVDWVMRYNNATYSEKGIVKVGVETVPEPAYLPNVGEAAYAEGGVCYDRSDGAYTGSPPLVRGETYCFTNVTFPAGDHQLAGTSDEPTKIYIAPSGNLHLGGSGNQRCDGVACVNWDHPTRPDATALEIYLANGKVTANNHTVIAAGIYAPTSDCSGPNAQGDIYGSIVCRTLDSKGGWEFHYDERFEDVSVDDFAIEGWREETLGSTSFGG